MAVRTDLRGPFSKNAPTTSEAANAIPVGRITLLSGSVEDVWYLFQRTRTRKFPRGSVPEKSIFRTKKKIEQRGIVRYARPAALDGFEFSPRFTIICVTRSTLIQGYWTCAEARRTRARARARVDQHTCSSLLPRLLGKVISRGKRRSRSKERERNRERLRSGITR